MDGDKEKQYLELIDQVVTVSDEPSKIPLTSLTIISDSCAAMPAFLT
jgi:hypothetical protein